MKKTLLYTELQRYSDERLLKLKLTQVEGGVEVEGRDYKLLSFLQNNRILHNGMQGNLIREGREK